MSKEIDTLILGCTHYSILKETIKSLYSNINIIDPSVEIVKIINNNNLIKCKDENSKTFFYVSGSKLQFENNLKNIFSIESDNIIEVKGE